MSVDDLRAKALTPQQAARNAGLVVMLVDASAVVERVERRGREEAFAALLSDEAVDIATPAIVPGDKTWPSKAQPHHYTKTRAALTAAVEYARAALLAGSPKGGDACTNCDGRGHYTSWPHTTCPTCEGSGLGPVPGGET